jgi:tetratricopeptide (TPR) repeat protein
MRYNWRSALFASLLILFVAAPAAARPPKTPVKGAPAATKVELTEAEKKLMADIEDGEFASIPLAEAALIASGMTDARKREAYAATIGLLEARARRTVAGAKTAAAKGEKLLSFLHAPGGPLKKYVHDQTSLAVLLDTGSFNCVSSAVLYNVLADRLGLNVRAVDLGDHAFSLLRDGDRGIDVETTTAKGFDPKRKKGAPAAEAKNRREVGAAGLVALVAANRCAVLGKEKRYPEAVRAGLCALGLDRDLKGADGNLRWTVAAWCRDLAAEGKVEDALTVLKLNGETLDAGARRDEAKGIYAARVEALLKQEKYEEAARIYADAAAGRHKGDEELAGHCRYQALACFDEWARPHVKKGEWARALEIFERAAEVLPDDPKVHVRLDYCRKKLGQSSAIAR